MIELGTKNVDRTLRFLTPYTLNKMENLAAGLVYKRVNVETSFGANCYTTADTNPVEIVLGAEFFKNYKTDLTVKQIRDSYIALFMHELGHVVFTDLDSVKSLDDEDRPVVFPIINIMEDYVVERAIGFIFGVNKFFVQLTQLCFGYIYDKVEEESHQGFLCALQAIHRCGESTARRNRIMDENWDFVSTNYYRIADILDPTERFEEQKKFAKQLLEMLKDYGIDPVKDFNDFIEELAQYLQEALESAMKSSGSGEQSKEMSESMSGDSDDGDEEEGSEEKRDGSGKSGDMSEAIKELKEQVKDAVEHKEDRLDDLERNPDRPWKQIIADQDSGVEIDGVNRNSQYRQIKDYTDAKMNLSGVIRQVEEAVKKCGIDYRETIPGQLQGQFNIREAMRPYNLRHFERVLEHSTDPSNLCFDIVLDVSGSMTGSCAKVSAMCVIALCEALENVHVDYRVHIYSSNYMMVKDINDRLKVIEPLMEKVLSSCYDDYYKGFNLWCGNNESLMMSKLRENSKHIQKDKIMVHIGDGGFYFSEKNYISNVMERCGYITTLGVGLFCDEMSKYHKNSITVMNDQELSKLPQAILDYVAAMFK